MACLLPNGAVFTEVAATEIRVAEFMLVSFMTTEVMIVRFVRAEIALAELVNVLKRNFFLSPRVGEDGIWWNLAHELFQQDGLGVQ